MLHHEHKKSPELLEKELHRSGLSLDLNDYTAVDGEPVAIIQLAGISGPQTEIKIIDLRDFPVRDGYRLYDGEYVDPSVELMVIDYANLDWQKGIGYKGLRAGESVVFGSDMMTDRFPNQPSTTSREHMTLSYDDGILTIEDHSLNGTVIRYPEELGVIHGDAKSLGRNAVEWLSGELPYRSMDLNAKILSDEDIKSVFEGLDSQAIPRNTLEIMDMGEEFLPIAGVGIGDREFMFSRLFSYGGSGDRLKSIVYSTGADGRLVARMAYKSKSDGGWRLAPYIYPDGTYSKGEGAVESLGYRHEYGQYTQVTKPDESVLALLEDMERSSEKFVIDSGQNKALFKYINYESYKNSDIRPDGWGESLNIIHVQDKYGRNIDAYSPGEGFTINRRAAIRALENLELPDGFTPDFISSAPLRVYKSNHTILGSTRVEVFAARYQGKTIEWHVANDKKTDTVWLDRITLPDGHINDLGVRNDVILAGALCAKPVEYRSQVWGLEPSDYDIDHEIYGDSYVGLKKLLNHMPWVRDYRKSLTVRSDPGKPDDGNSWKILKMRFRSAS